MEGTSDEAGPQDRASPDQNHPDTCRDDVLDEVLAYAYGNDLIRDCRLSAFSLSHLFGKLVQSTIPATTEDGFTDCSQLTSLELPNPTPRGERPITTNSALKLICEASRGLPNDEAKALLTQQVCDAGRIGIRYLKLELPALEIDNEQDMRDLQFESLTRRDAPQRDHRIPFDPIDVAAGQGLALSHDVRLQVQAFLRGIEGEKIGVTRESTRFLVGIVRTGLTNEDRKNFIAEEVENIKFKQVSVLAPSCHLFPNHTCVNCHAIRIQHWRSWSFPSAQNLIMKSTQFLHRMHVWYRFLPTQALRSSATTSRPLRQACLRMTMSLESPCRQY